MKDLNPTAFNLWLFGASLGYAIADLHGLSVGLTIALGITLAVNLLPGR